MIFFLHVHICLFFFPDTQVNSWFVKLLGGRGEGEVGELRGRGFCTSSLTPGLKICEGDDSCSNKLELTFLRNPVQRKHQVRVANFVLASPANRANLQPTSGLLWCLCFSVNTDLCYCSVHQLSHGFTHKQIKY